MPRVEKSNQSVVVHATLSARAGAETPPARVYVFDRRDALLDSQPVTGKPLTLPLSGQSLHRVVVGPDIPAADRSHADLAAELSRAGAITRDVDPRRGLEAISLQIPPSVYLCWWKTCIYVHGSVRKQTAPGVYVPICDGIVQIFQVDLGCTLDRLASFTDAPVWYSVLIDALAGLERSVLDERIRLIKNLPDPPPDSFHETRLLPPQLAGRSFRAGSVAEAALAPAASAATLATSARSIARGAALEARSPAELASTLRSLPRNAVKDTILANKAIVAPFLCMLIPDEWFCWQELGEAVIQSDGTFSAEICFWCPDDFPDLYFEVVQTVGGIAREISDPQIACSTYYDYDGSEDVVITVTDPTAVACNDPKPRPIPGDEYYVWPTAIGNVDLRGINGLEDPPGAAPQGLLGAAPWAGTLALQMEFDPRLRSDGIARYYRWSYKFDGDAGFSPITAPVNHRYRTVTFSPLQIHLHTVNLGPHTMGSEQNLFDIPEPYPGDGWVNINDPYDRPFGYFDTTDNHYAPFSYTDALPRRSGLCTLMLELFDSSGTFVPCGNNGVGGPFVFVLPDLGGAPTDYTSVLGSNNITPSGQLLFRVLIDNHDTYATLDGVTAGLNHADPCGILHYGSLSDNVAIAFHGTHPNNYLTWSLGVWRGSAGEIAATGGNSSSPPQAPNPYSNPASALLGPCADAAFAVNLWTSATATDGYGTQTQYNRFASIAFALLNP